MNFKKSYKSQKGYTPICKIGECSLKKLEFGIIELGSGENLDFYTEDKETAFIMLEGHCNVKVNGEVVAEFDADTKLDKVTSKANVTRVYSINEDGSQGTIEADQEAKGDSIVRRNNGHIALPSDMESYIDDFCAVPKKYVDENIGDIQSALDNLHEYAQSLVGGVE